MRKDPVLRLHRFIIIFFLLASIIGFFVFFFVLSGDTVGPLFRKANQLDFELLVTRRVASLIIWMIFSALSIYIGVTEIFPMLAEKKKIRLILKIINILIIISYVVSIFYASHQFSIIFFEDRLQMKIVRLLYLSDLGMVFFGLLIYLMLLSWIPTVVEKKYSRYLSKENKSGSKN